MQSFKQSYLCLHAREYEMLVEETGEKISGISVHYVPDNNLTPREDLQTLEQRGQIVRGINVAKHSFPMSARDNLKDFPAIYDFEMEMAVVGGKLQARPKSIKFSHAVKLVPEK